MVKSCLFIALLCCLSLRASFSPDFLALYEQARLSSTQKNYSKALLLLEKTKPLTAPDSGLYSFLLGSILRIQKKVVLSEPLLIKSAQYLTRSQHHVHAGDAFNELGSLYREMNRPVDALQQYQTAIKMYALGNDSILSSGPLHNIGMIYYNQNDFVRSKHYLARAVSLNIARRKTNWLCLNYQMLGKIYMMTMEKDSSLKYCERALELARTGNKNFDIASAQHLLGVCHGYFNDLKKARVYFDSALAIRLAIKDTVEILNSFGALGELMFLENRIPDAKKYILSALELSRAMKNIQTIESAASILLEIAQKENNYKDMYTYYRLMREMKDSMSNAKTTKLLLEKEYQFNYEKKEHELRMENDKKIMHAEKEKEKQKLVSWFVAIGLGIMFIFSLLLLNRFNVIRKQKKLIEKQKQAVELQQRETEHQKHIVEEKQKEILDSIRYAQRIQSALIASEHYINRELLRLRKR